jgi:hypothetical protein
VPSPIGLDKQQSNGKRKKKHLTNAPPEATREEMSAARLPLAYRDSCAHLLIPLNRCRHEEYYLPWKCEVHGPPDPDPDPGALPTIHLLDREKN